MPSELMRNAWPLGGFAPGNYTCKCLDCKVEFTGDKRAIQCLECAVMQAKKAHSAVRNDAMEADNTICSQEARLEALEAENGRLREALEPFAAFAEFDATGTAYEGQGDDAAILFDHKTERQVTIGHLRAARRAREGGKEDD